MPIAVPYSRTNRPDWAKKDEHGNPVDNIPIDNAESMLFLLDQAVWEPDQHVVQAIGIAVILQIAKDFGYTKEYVFAAMEEHESATKED